MSIRLLVSVRNADEAVTAVEAGADIIDVKEPNDGSLGFAGADVIASVIDAVGGRCPVSAALGESVDWRGQNVPQLPMPLQFMKIGLAHIMRANIDAAAVTVPAEPTRSTGHAAASWSDAWQHTRHRFEDAAAVTSAERQPNWVAVIYADYAAADSPEPKDIVQEAYSSGCAGVLIDTYEKTGMATPDLLSTAELRDLRTSIKDTGMFFALAGGITLSHVPLIKPLAPDILAVRGAACTGARTNSISSKKIRQLRHALNAG